MKKIIPKKQLLYWLFISFFFQIIGISNATAQGATTPFKTTWIATGGSITIPTNSGAGVYNYTINYRKKGTTPFTTISGRTGNYTISGLTATDTIQVEITGVFPSIFMFVSSTAEKAKLLTIDAWGNQAWRSMFGSFTGCSDLTYTATDNPDLNQVTDMSYMFQGCSKFNGNVGGWSTINVTNMARLFFGAAAFNQPLNLWNTAKVTDMSLMFSGATIFNQNISSWQTGAVTNMTSMFENCTKFNQNISGWNTSRVTTMRSMFQGAVEFNQPIGTGTWNTRLVTDMGVMFAGATKFNQNISNWNTANVTNMNAMFSRASSFDQDLSGLELNSLSMALSMLDNCGLSIDNYDATLTGWASQTKTNIELGAAGLEYCSAEAARTTLTGSKFWRIVGDAKCTPFKTTWIATGGSINIPTNGFTRYNYDINYRKKGTIPFTTVSGRTGSYTISGLTATDTIQVEIMGVFPYFYMNNDATEKTKLLSIDTWGNQNWKNMRLAFYGCSNLIYKATDNPDLSSVIDMGYMFSSCSKFNGNVGSWNTINVTDMTGVFSNAILFNQDISSWNTVNVTTMYLMFQGASKFNQNIGIWNTGKVNNMISAFESASDFNQDLSQWNTSNVLSMSTMFINATKFNQPLTNWNTAKVQDMRSMFKNATAFNQDLSVLEIDAVFSYALNNMLDNSGLSTANYDATLTGWSLQNKTSLSLGASGLKYCTAEAARTTLTTATTSGGKGWTITGDTKQCPTTPFKTTWKVANNNIIIPTSTFAGAYNYTVNYRKQGTTPFTTISGQTGNCTISGLTNDDIIEVEITGVFPHFYMFNNSTEKDKLLSIEAWGNQNWKSMRNAFSGCSNLIYNAIDKPDLSSLNDMASMFFNCSKFNGNIGDWNTVGVGDMTFTFRNASAFNQNISTWNTSNVTTMSGMFEGAVKFNQPLTNWNTAKVTDMRYMFSDASAFNQDLSVLELDAVVSPGLSSMLNNSGLSVANYDATLTGWATQTKTGLTLGATGLNYCTSEAARTTLITATTSGGKGWTITGDSQQCPFKTTWRVANGNIIIPTNSASGPYNYTVNYRKQGTTTYTTITNQTGDCTIPGLTNNDIIEVEITGVFPHFYMNGSRTERTKLLTIDAWGNQNWKSMNNSFFGCTNLTYNATDNPDLSSVTDMSRIFANCSRFNGNIGGWSTNNVINMSSMFSSAFAFNQNIGSWSTGNVTNMSSMFSGAAAFNQKIGTWNTDKVTNMSFMFSSDNGTIPFNQNIGFWNTSNVTVMNSMFNNAIAFNQNIGSWNTGKVTTTESMFRGATKFNQNIDAWTTDNVTDMSFMFYGASDFNQPIGTWKTGSVIKMNEMFRLALSFNQNIGNWDVSKVTDMSAMFVNTPMFNQNLNLWNTINVTNMSGMFIQAVAFNQNIGSWNTGQVTNMGQMFEDARTFNQDISSWQTGAVTNMGGMFSGAISFNQPIGTWNTGNVTGMTQMFSRAISFNQYIGDWNTANVTAMYQMFNDATAFNQSIGKWDMRKTTSTTFGTAFEMLKNSGMDCANYSATLFGWANSATPATNVNLGAVSINSVNRQYGTNAASARTTLTNRGWTITGDVAGTVVCAFGPPAPIASAQSHCQGKTVADLVATGQNIQWYTAATGSTALATTTVLTTTTYYASQTVSGIESERTAVSVTVNAPTIATVTLSPTTICAGTSGTITPTITNGGNSYTYVWKINQVTQTTTSPTINCSNATANDEYSLTITPSADACPIVVSVTASVRVTPLTTPTISGNNEICEGEIASLTANSLNLFFNTNPVYQWSNGMSGSNIQVSPIVTATYSVIVTVDGCSSEPSAAFTVIVNPKPAMPTITADNIIICKGGIIILTGTCAATTDIFRWETPSFGNALSNSNQRNITQPGVYKGLCESNKGCLSEKQSITITLAEGCNPANFITVSPEKPAICPNTSINLTANGCSGGTVTWLYGTSSQTGNNISVSPSVTTSYFVNCSTGGSTIVDVVVAVPNIMVATNISTGKEIYKAINTIQSNKKIGDANFTPAPNVIYEAGGSITLSPGFVAEKWSVFKAEIKTCTN